MSPAFNDDPPERLKFLQQRFDFFRCVPLATQLITSTH